MIFILLSVRILFFWKDHSRAQTRSRREKLTIMDLSAAPRLGLRFFLGCGPRPRQALHGESSSENRYFLRLPDFRNALGDTNLLARVVEHKTLFFQRAWARYDLAEPGSLRLTPPDYLLGELREDYSQMAEEMMFGEVPQFDSVIDALNAIEASVNAPANAR